jgi:hypothetical protein
VGSVLIARLAPVVFERLALSGCLFYEEPVRDVLDSRIVDADNCFRRGN